MKTIGVIVIALVALLALTGSVMADPRVNATPEVQGITTTTFIDVVGTATDTDSLTWSITNLAGLAPPLQVAESMAMTTYSDKLTAIDGFVTWKKDAMISTADQIGTPNVQMDAALTFDAAEGQGRAIRTESLMLDTVGNERVTANSLLCPFAIEKSSTVPEYCNYVTMGSSIDTSITSTATQAKESFIGVVSDFPVTMNYQIAAKGLQYGGTTFPMQGSASAAIVVDIREARNGTGLAETLVYKETSTASGSINSFNKVMGYQSGFIIH
jgi:hypothetical protein